MIKILSWNIGKKKTVLLQNVLADIVDENGIDIVVLQEAYGTFVNSILDMQYEEIPYPGNGIGSGVRIFLKRHAFTYFSINRTDNKKLVFIHLKKIGCQEEFNIAAVHLHSKVGNTERQQLWKNVPIINKINEFEKISSNNTNTIIVGDFNHNPYENNMCDPYVLNCQNDKNLISTFTNFPLSKKNLNFWYNPMWNFLGDFDSTSGKERTTGTFFRYTEDETPMWSLLDGFILRSSIMDRIDYSQSQILTSTKNIKFLKPLIIRADESIIQDDLSDHLPIKFSISIN